MISSGRNLHKWLLCFCISATTVAFSQSPDTVNYSKRTDELRKGVLVTGKITAAANRAPLSGIRLTYQDYSAAITDSVGNFSLKVPNYNVAVEISGEGFQLKEIALKGRKSFNAVLYEESYASFSDVANLPFANTTITQTPYAVTSIDTRGNWNRTTETPDALLQGKVAGLNAVRRSGTPNAGANLFLRGINSLNTTNQPLIIVDGIIFDYEDYGTSIMANNASNPLAYIDVKDIDNITVVKDGSSTYGTKGANGVIIITTARAKELATRIDVVAYGGINYAPANLPVLNAQDYRLYLSDVLQSKGLTNSQVQTLPYMIDDQNNSNYYRYHNQTDWQKKVLDNSSLKNVYLKVTGGDNIAKYALSLGVLKNGGVVPNTDMSRYNMRFNADLNLSSKLTGTANLAFTQNEQNVRDQGIAPGTNPLYTALVKAPFIGVNEVSDKGLESPSLTDSDTFNVSNPLVLLNNTRGLNRNYRFVGSVGFNYAFNNALSLSTQVGITIDKVRETMFIPRKGVVNDTLSDGSVADSRLGTTTGRIMTIFNDTRLSYNKTFNRIHHLTARAGFRFQNSRNEQDFAFSANSATDELTSVGNGVNTSRRTGGGIGEYKWLNTYLGSDYSLSNKYFVSVNVAFDGSSRFGSNASSGALKVGGGSYAVMPSIAGAWLLSSERFMAQNRLFDLLKIRASAGLSGNDNIGNYTARQTYSSQNLLGMQGLVRNNLGNEQLQWETVRKLNLGLDMAFLNERLNVSLDAYSNKTSNMLIYEAMPTASGITMAATNSGGMKTSGVEASVTGRVINRPSVKWDLGVTLAHYNSTVTKLPTSDIMNGYAEATILSRNGQAPNVFYGYKTRGVYSTDAEASADGFVNIASNGSAVPFRGGDMRFTDLNGDKIINESDREIIGNPNPDLFGSIFNRIEWKRFSLEGLLTFTKGNDIYNYTRRQLESLSGTNNQTIAVNNRWRSNGQVTDIPRAAFGDPTGNSRFSDRWIEDGSYLRLRTATLTYNIPVKTNFLRYSIVYLTANNLFTLTKYRGYDPETSATSSVIGQGVDITLQPQYRSVQLGLRFGL
jgi:TonB-linked SusC/RagA family outer membrane protein